MMRRRRELADIEYILDMAFLLDRAHGRLSLGRCEATRFKIKSGVREDGSKKPASEVVRDAAADMRYRQK